ncbi:MAG TPA: ANTAR domain-containing protein [Mycobacteriales bacterium]|nr:ANTAR domain-containing protein [Mycobacteriales bacterium]
MSERDESTDAWDRRLSLAEAALARREQRALAASPTPSELAAFAAERDKIALDRDALADAYDEQARGRDSSALGRDATGSARDRRARARRKDLDVAFPDRSAAGVDRDDAAGDRGDSFDDRERGHLARDRAAADREQARTDRDRSSRQSADQDDEMAGLRTALESRLVIGQAVGLLMARNRIPPDEAFAVLVRLSQHRNLKVRELAVQIVAHADVSHASNLPA